jgi:hypothetical protein
MAEPLRMSLDWAGLCIWERENDLHKKRYGLEKGFSSGSKKRLLFNCFSFDLSFKIWFELNLNKV